jgi:hypothetical protein
MEPQRNAGSGFEYASKCSNPYLKNNLDKNMEPQRNAGSGFEYASKCSNPYLSDADLHHLEINTKFTSMGLPKH